MLGKGLIRPVGAAQGLQLRLFLAKAHRDARLQVQVFSTKSQNYPPECRGYTVIEAEDFFLSSLEKYSHELLQYKIKRQNVHDIASSLSQKNAVDNTY